MASFADEVAEYWLSGAPHAQLRELCRDWKRVRTPYSVTRAIANAAEDGRGRELYETFLDDDFQDLRQQMSGADGLREDIRAGLDYFSGSEPDLLKYLQVMFLEQAASDQGFVAAHQQHCQGFADFLQLDLLPHERRPVGLHKVLQRFFPVHPMPYWLMPAIDLVGYELGTWRCSCGALTGIAARYGFSCPCGTVCGTGRLAPGTTACTTCTEPPAYTPCPVCGTRPTLENLWQLREGNAHPSAYQIPLVLQLLVRHSGRETAENARLPLMLLPIPLGTREREGSIVFGIPDLLWLGDAFPTSTHFIGLGDSLRYDGRVELRRIFEAMARRTLLKFPHNSYEKFGDYIASRLENSRDTVPDYSLTRSFQQRIGERLADRSGAGEDMLRFIELSADCTVGASSALRASAVLASSLFADSPLLSVPHLLSMRTELDHGASLTAQPPGGDADYAALLDASGLACPGRTAQPGQALAGIARPVTQYDRLTPEEKLLETIFGTERSLLRDASMRMPGGRPGRILTQHIAIGSSSAEAIPPAPGRILRRRGASITMTVVVDRPLEVGDTLLDCNGGRAAAVVSGIRSAWELSQIAGTSTAPDLLVAPDHPWAPPAGTGTRRIRVRLSKDDPGATDMTYRGTGYYHPLTDQPVGGAGPDGTPAILTPREFRWLISKQARHLALELYGPRSDCRTWRQEIRESLNGESLAIPAPAGKPLAQWTSLSDSPSGAMLEWELLLRCARIRSRVSPDRIVFHLMTDAEVLELSHGEVTRSGDNPLEGPDPAGLFSERIFGTLGGSECPCGKYRGSRVSVATCEQCGVRQAGRNVRRHRMGHIELPAAVVHSWFLHGAPLKRLADLLEISTEELTQIAECTRYVVADPGTTSLRRGQIMLTSADNHFGGVRLAVGGEAIGILLQRAGGPREVDLTADRLLIRRIPVLPPSLRTERDRSNRFRSSPLYNHYSAIVGLVANEFPRLTRGRVAPWEDSYFRWHAELQSKIDALFGSAISSPDDRPLGNSGGAPASIADRLCWQGRGTVKDRFLTRTVDFSANAKLVTSDTGDIGRALLPGKIIRTLLRPMTARAPARTESAGSPSGAWKLTGKQAPQSRTALNEPTAQTLVLLSLPVGPWPLVAMRFRPANDHAVHIHPHLLDQVGWDNIGQPAKIFGILTDSASHEAERLLTPASLLDKASHYTQAKPPGNSIFDLTPENLIAALTSAAWTGTPFPLEPEDPLLLCAADWTGG